MSFFASDIVQEELQTLASLKILRDSMITITKPNLTRAEAIERIDLLQNSLDKIKIFYIRFSLSDDNEAIELKKKVHALSILLGKNSIMEVFEEIQQIINTFQSEVNKQ
jgi:hypothetical protein